MADQTLDVLSNYEVEAGPRGRTITFLVAPDIPESELPALEAHYKEVVADPDCSMVVNYDLYITTVFVDPSSRLVAVAPDVPPATLNKLRARINDKTQDIIAVNHSLSAFTIPIED